MTHRSQARVQPSFAHVRSLAGLGAVCGALLLGAVWPSAQVASGLGLVVGRNVNIVSGQALPNGDPYLQRQNEPSVAASTRNPLHLLAGANDYRTVDIPGNFNDGETGDAWLGVFKSFDGGERWQSTLLPGYPQDTSAAGMASPLKAYHAGADPVVRPGTNGLLYYAGLAFNRGEGGASAIFVSRFVDNNNKENGDPIAYISTSLVARSSGAAFLDKPWMAVDVPRAGAKACRITTQQPAPLGAPSTRQAVAPTPKGASGAAVSAAAQNIKNTRTTQGTPTTLPTPGIVQATSVTQQVLAGTMYVAYAQITTTTLATGAADIESRIMFSRSDDCGVSWTTPVQISDPAHKVNQGATIAVDPNTGAAHVAWRQFGLTATAPDAIMTVVPTVSAKTRKTPIKVHEFKPGPKASEIQPKLQRAHRHGDVKELVSIRPFDSGTGPDRFRTNAYPTMAIDDESRVYVAWTERGFAGARPDALIGDARVVLATSRGGGLWTKPRAVDSLPTADDMPGHQMMPSMSYSGGRLLIVYYDLREDVSRIFGPWVSETDAVASANRRHTIDVRAVQAPKGDVPAFGPSTMVSQYLMGNLRGSGGNIPQQLQFNAPNLPLFQLGTVPFMGDYIDVAPAPAFVQNTTGTWIHNTANTSAPVFHAVWTDNRDVQKPANGDWKNYTPPGSATCAVGQTGMRNQNVYSARLTMGLVAGSPGNTKPLSTNVPRGFVVFAQNLTYQTKAFRFTIQNQPVGGNASFSQLGLINAEPLLLQVDVKVAPRSMVTRTVYATSTNAKEQVRVSISEVGIVDLLPLSGGLTTTVILNPDISNPDISNPDISNPDISNPDISNPDISNPDISNAEVYNPDISNPDISNPDISNPDISNPDISNPDISNVLIANPDISNPDISNPDISNPDISNPDISNPDISNPDISNGSLTDVTWTIRNNGNTTAAFNVNLFLANQAAATAGGIKTQLVVHKSYKTPISDGCVLKSQTQTVLVAKVDDPVFLSAGDDTSFDAANPDISNTTLWLEPGAEGKITLRIVDPNPTDNVTINPVTDVTPVVQAESINTQDLSQPAPEPPATPLPTDPVPPPAVALAFVAQPVNTLVNAFMPDITVSAFAGANAAPGVQVTLAIAINPSGGNLVGTVTTLTDAAGIATFSGLLVNRDGANYRLSASASASGALPVLSNTFTVGAAPADPFVVTSPVDALVLGTLRYALTEANAAPGVQTITFNIGGVGEQVIALAASLPVVTGSVVIDATTQPGYDGRPMIRLHGAGAGMGSYGLHLQATSTIRGLSITGFGNAGVLVDGGGTASVVEQNYIGTDRAGAGGLGNNAGVMLSGTTNVVVRQNLLSGNVYSGVIVASGALNEIRNNRIGTGFDGLGYLSNADNGITLYDGADATLIDGNLISGNGTVLFFNIAFDNVQTGAGNGFGIDIQQSGDLADVTNTIIVNNIIGLDAAGNLINRGGADWVGPGPTNENFGPRNRGNAGGGIRVHRGSGTIIGRNGEGNTISGNTGTGVSLTGLVGTAPILRGNRIGTDPMGTQARGNRRGIEVFLSRAVVGQPGVGNGNQVSGNLSDGIWANGDTTIENNLVGVNAWGTLALGNARIMGNGTPEIGCCHTGIFVDAPANIVRGNVVGGSSAHDQDPGIRSGGAAGAQPNLIERNYVGTNPTLTADFGNGIGIGLYGDKSGTTVRANYVLNNVLAGIWLVEGTEDALIGGAPNTGSGNVIRNNGAGILIGYNSTEPDKGNAIQSNAIYSNTNLGIDLGFNGVTANDVGDGDTGPNRLMNFPVLSNVNSGGATTAVDMVLDTDTPNAKYDIQVFASAACHATSYGQGERLVGTFGPVSNGSGDIVTNLVLTEAVLAGQFLTATATSATAGTSEFSQCVQVPAGATGSITSASPSNEAPGEGFMVLRGSNLPATIGDVIAVVSNGVTTMNGFWFASPSSPTAGYVRMPFGMPLGAATVRLRNGAGTAFTNAFPVTITAVPGTPVITNILDGAYNPITSPVATGSKIAVQADGIDTTGAVVRFTQGATNWDVSAELVASSPSIGMVARVTVPAAAAGGPINVSIRQGASAFSPAKQISVQASGATLVGPVGGGGGSAFGPIMCPSGSVATAFRGRAGDDVDRTELWCSTVQAGPSLGSAAFAGGVGGTGGTDYGGALTCPAGAVMTGIHGTAGGVVDSLGVTCTYLAGGAYQSTAIGRPGVGISPGATAFALNCAAGQEVVGFVGRQGNVLDQIGIYCSNAAAPVPEATMESEPPAGPQPARPTPLVDAGRP